MDRFQLADGVHVAHAVYQRDDAFADGSFQLLFTQHFIVSQRENQRRTKAFNIHAEHGEDFHHLNTAPQEQRLIGMALRLRFAVAPGLSNALTGLRVGNTETGDPLVEGEVPLSI